MGADAGVIANMVEAIDLEIAEIKKKGGTPPIDLSEGERTGQSGSSTLYSFIVGYEKRFRDDTPVRLLVAGDEIDGTILEYDDGRLTVALARDLGPRIASAQLVLDDTFLLEALRERLQEVDDGQVSFREGQARQVIGGQVAYGREPAEQIDLDRLNDRQREAVSTALGSSTTFVWGPPGTGKTETVGRIVAAHYRRGRSVLVLSNTNVAVDTALIKVCERLHDESGFDRGLVLRYGPLAKPELIDKWSEYVDIEKVVERMGAELHRHRAELEGRRADIVSRLRELSPMIRTAAELEGIRRELAGAEDELRRAGAARDRAESELATARGDVEALRRRLQEVQAMGRLRRWTSGADPAKVARQLAAAEEHVIACDADLGSADRALQAAAAERDDLRHRLRAAEAAAGLRAPLAKLQAEHSDLHRRLEPVEAGIARIDAELGRLREQALQRCRITAATVYQTWLRGHIERRYDVVVIDEASMLALPMSYFAAGLAGSSVVVAGDFRQLAPITRNDDPVVLGWMRRDVFEASGIRQAVDADDPPAHLVMLTTQYRMREEICALVNHRFYDGRLTTAPSAREQEVRSPLGRSPLLYVDTSVLRPWAALKTGEYSRYNLFHALLVRSLVHWLKADGFLSGSDALGLISPYRSEVRFFERFVDVLGKGWGEKAAATVHRFQGSERDVIVFEVPEAPGVWIGTPVRGTRIEEDGGRLLDVALSRARTQVVLLADVDELRAHLPKHALLREVVSAFEARGEALDAFEVLAKGPRPWIEALGSFDPSRLDAEPDASGRFDAGASRSALTRDLLAARQSVLILSPTATEEGLGAWSELLVDRVSQDIKVRLIVSPHGHGATGMLDDLVASGVVVDRRQGMVEKAVVLDGDVLWFGNADVLGDLEAGSNMFRVVDPAVCSEFAKHITTPMRRPRDRPVDAADRESPECGRCGVSMTWRSGRHGIYFECPDCRATVSSRQVAPGQMVDRPVGNPSRADQCVGIEKDDVQRPLAGATGRQPPAARVHDPGICPDCGRALCERRGPYGTFIGCSGYPQCRYRRSLE